MNHGEIGIGVVGKVIVNMLGRCRSYASKSGK